MVVICVVAKLVQIALKSDAAYRHGLVRPNAPVVADDLMEYIDSGEMSDLSDAQAGLELAPAYIAQLLTARTAYLEAAGFGSDEIAEMMA